VGQALGLVWLQPIPEVSASFPGPKKHGPNWPRPILVSLALSREREAAALPPALFLRRPTDRRRWSGNKGCPLHHFLLSLASIPLPHCTDDLAAPDPRGSTDQPRCWRSTSLLHIKKSERSSTSATCHSQITGENISTTSLPFSPKFRIFLSAIIAVISLSWFAICGCSIVDQEHI
jgi:hypothetical protein